MTGEISEQGKVCCTRDGLQQGVYRNVCMLVCILVCMQAMVVGGGAASHLSVNTMPS